MRNKNISETKRGINRDYIPFVDSSFLWRRLLSCFFLSYSALIAQRIFVELARLLRMHSSLEGRMTSLNIRNKYRSDTVPSWTFSQCRSSPEWNVRIAALPPGARASGSFSMNASRTSYSLFTSIRSAWKVRAQDFFDGFFFLVFRKKIQCFSDQITQCKRSVNFLSFPKCPRNNLGNFFCISVHRHFQ